MAGHFQSKHCTGWRLKQLANRKLFADRLQKNSEQNGAQFSQTISRAPSTLLRVAFLLFSPLRGWGNSALRADTFHQGGKTDKSVLSQETGPGFSSPKALLTWACGQIKKKRKQFIKTIRNDFRKQPTHSKLQHFTFLNLHYRWAQNLV